MERGRKLGIFWRHRSRPINISKPRFFKENTLFLITGICMMQGNYLPNYLPIRCFFGFERVCKLYENHLYNFLL